MSQSGLHLIKTLFSLKNHPFRPQIQLVGEGCWMWIFFVLNCDLLGANTVACVKKATYKVSRK